MIPYARLRTLLAGWPKYPGCQPVRRAPLVTPAFPGDFNLSSTEHHWLRELGGYLDWHRDYVFSTIQSCVRLADFAFLSTADGVRYLGVFEMGDLCGEIALRVRPDYDSLQRWQIAELIRLLETVGIPPARIHASYSAGGRIADLTGGAYQFDGAIPPDALSRDAFLAAGVPDATSRRTPRAPRCSRCTCIAPRRGATGTRSMSTLGCPATRGCSTWRRPST